MTYGINMEEYFHLYELEAFNSNIVFIINIFSEPEPNSGKNILVVGSAGLLLGLLFSVTGFLYFKKKSIGERVVKSNKNIIKIIEILYFYSF